MIVCDIGQYPLPPDNIWKVCRVFVPDPFTVIAAGEQVINAWLMQEYAAVFFCCWDVSEEGAFMTSPQFWTLSVVIVVFFTVCSLETGVGEET